METGYYAAQRSASGAVVERSVTTVACRVEPEVTHPPPPTDPDVRHSRIRFLRQSGCCPCAVHWPSVVRVGELKVSPLCPASGRSARRRLPSRGSRGPRVPTFAGTKRRYDCHPVPFGALRLSLATPIPCRLPSFVVSVSGSSLGGSPEPRRGLWSAGPPLPALEHGDRMPLAASLRTSSG